MNVVDGWLRSSLFGRLAALLLDPSALMFDVVRPELERTFRAQHRSKRQDNHKRLFRLALFEQWLRSAGGRRPRKMVCA